MLESRSLNDRVTPFASLPKPPPIMPIWAKVIWYLVETAATGTLWQQFESGDVMQPTQSVETDPDASVWTRWRFDWHDTATNDTADTQNFTIDVVNYTSGVIDSSWTDTDFNLVGNAVGTFGATIAAGTTPYKRLTKIAAYLMAFRPYSDPKPFAISGGPVYERAMSSVGAGGGQVPMQVRSTVTEETPSRRHWGRLYLPTPGGSSIAADGTLAPAYVDAAANAYVAMVTSLLASQFQVVVPTTQSGYIPNTTPKQPQPARTLQNITGVRCDSTPDIIRSGRRHVTAYRKILPVETQTLPAEDAQAA